MNKYVLLIVSLVCVKLYAADQKRNFDINQSFSVDVVSYKDCFWVIQEGSKSLSSACVFNPMPCTLHELLKRNDVALVQHEALHDHLVSSIRNAQIHAIEDIILQMRELGIGICYEPGLRLLTELRAISSSTILGVKEFDDREKNAINSNNFHYFETCL